MGPRRCRVRGCVNPEKRSPAPVLEVPRGWGLEAEGGSLGAVHDSRMAELVNQR